MRYTIEQMKKICPTCAKRMEENHITSAELPKDFKGIPSTMVKIKLGEYKYDKKTGRAKCRKPIKIFTEKDNEIIMQKLKGVKNADK